MERGVFDRMLVAILAQRREEEKQQHRPNRQEQKPLEERQHKPDDAQDDKEHRDDKYKRSFGVSDHGILFIESVRRAPDVS